MTATQQDSIVFLRDDAGTTYGIPLAVLADYRLTEEGRTHVEEWLAADTQGLGWLQVNLQTLGVVPTGTIELKIEESQSSSGSTVQWWVKQEVVLSAHIK